MELDNFVMIYADEPPVSVPMYELDMMANKMPMRSTHGSLDPYKGPRVYQTTRLSSAAPIRLLLSLHRHRAHRSLQRPMQLPMQQRVIPACGAAGAGASGAVAMLASIAKQAGLQPPQMGVPALPAATPKVPGMLALEDAMPKTAPTPVPTATPLGGPTAGRTPSLADVWALPPAGDSPPAFGGPPAAGVTGGAPAAGGAAPAADGAGGAPAAAAGAVADEDAVADAVVKAMAKAATGAKAKAKAKGVRRRPASAAAEGGPPMRRPAAAPATLRRPAGALGCSRCRYAVGGCGGPKGCRPL